MFPPSLCNELFYDKVSRLSIPICWPLDIGIYNVEPENRTPHKNYIDSQLQLYV